MILSLPIYIAAVILTVILCEVSRSVYLLYLSVHVCGINKCITTYTRSHWEFTCPGFLLLSLNLSLYLSFFSVFEQNLKVNVWVSLCWRTSVFSLSFLSLSFHRWHLKYFKLQSGWRYQSKLGFVFCVVKLYSVSANICWSAQRKWDLRRFHIDMVSKQLWFINVP